MKRERNTNQKEMIKAEVQLHQGHLTGDQIYALVKEKMPGIGRATVFRNLKDLTEKGEIGYIPTVDGAGFFDYRKHNHYHFKCTKCNRLFDTNVPYNDSLDKVDSRFKIQNHVTLFYGICPECEKMKNN
ncbi:Fur family transcriptional regulator [Anaerorhabdus sp.]|uniref:Fur family transcriptional regulator n=1 Tax=Anaerorhabdus sp. TaxID=1872524 RepID=UPI002FC63241